MYCVILDGQHAHENPIHVNSLQVDNDDLFVVVVVNSLLYCLVDSGNQREGFKFVCFQQKTGKTWYSFVSHK